MSHFRLRLFLIHTTVCQARFHNTVALHRLLLWRYYFLSLCSVATVINLPPIYVYLKVPYISIYNYIKNINVHLPYKRHFYQMGSKEHSRGSDLELSVYTIAPMVYTVNYLLQNKKKHTN